MKESGASSIMIDNVMEAAAKFRGPGRLTIRKVLGQEESGDEDEELSEMSESEEEEVVEELEADLNEAAGVVSAVGVSAEQIPDRRFVLTEEEEEWIEGKGIQSVVVVPAKQKVPEEIQEKTRPKQLMKQWVKPPLPRLPR